MKKRISDRTVIAVAQTDIEYIKASLTSIQKDLSSNYVTKTEFWPVKSLVYGGAGVTLITVFGWLLSTVVKK